ncbi:MAG: xanthine dehydrogenase family protein molybdopterin-binding subunit, partial [Sphingomonadales bacterium]|nr:xanthine dehydrogenase family protein molybdopterin-binding subunit [Sphingomonadales bacterium]
MNTGVPFRRMVGQRLPRKEDARLLTGRGQYVDDVRMPGMLHCVFVRSPAARGRIVSLNTEAALALPGVQAIYTHADLAAVPVQMMTFFFTPIAAPISLIANGRVACVGDPVAMVIAESRAIAEDAAALVELEIDEEDPVVTIADARTGPLVHPGTESNVAQEMGMAEVPEPIQAIFDKAAHRVTRTIRHQRIAPSPMEARGCVASADGAEELLIHISCQSPHLVARYVSTALGLPQESIRVIAKDVGGAFGLKNIPWREEMAVIVAARLFK